MANRDKGRRKWGGFSQGISVETLLFRERNGLTVSRRCWHSRASNFGPYLSSFLATRSDLMCEINLTIWANLQTQRAYYDVALFYGVWPMRRLSPTIETGLVRRGRFDIGDLRSVSDRVALSFAKGHSAWQIPASSRVSTQTRFRNTFVKIDISPRDFFEFATFIDE